VKIRLPKPIVAGKVLVTVGLRDDDTLPNFAKDLDIDDTPENIVICDPPLFARYVMIESKDGGYLQLCEVDVYAAGNPLPCLFKIRKSYIGIYTRWTVHAFHAILFTSNKTKCLPSLFRCPRNFAPPPPPPSIIFHPARFSLFLSGNIFNIPL
jgi:hypothetical protein